LLLFNCGNINIVTGLRAEQRGNLVRYQTWARGFSFVKSLKSETVIHKQPYSIVTGHKQPEREADIQRHSLKMKDQPTVTAATVVFLLLLGTVVLSHYVSKEM
jgi:hypothetical protein